MGSGALEWLATPAPAIYFSERPCNSRQAPLHIGVDEPASPTENERERRDASKLVSETERGTSKGSSLSMQHNKGISFFDASSGSRPKRRPSSNKTLRAIEDAMASHWTEAISACLILLNVVFMILEGQYKGARIGYDLGFYSHYGSDAFREETGAPSERVFYVADAVFAIVFTVELFLRLVFLRSEFLCDCWGWLDIAVVAVTDFILIAGSTSINVSLRVPCAWPDCYGSSS